MQMVQQYSNKQIKRCSHITNLTTIYKDKYLANCEVSEWALVTPLGNEFQREIKCGTNEYKKLYVQKVE